MTESEFELSKKMYNLRNSFEPVLTIDEIKDFINCNTDHLPETLPQNIKYTPPTKRQYHTKKEITEEIKLLNKQIDMWMRYNYDEPNVYYDICLEECTEKKQKLKKMLEYVSLDKTDFNNSIVEAKRVPIDRFVEFNSADFAKCLWHPEKSPSLHYIRKDNKCHCFGCGTTKDTIDVVMALNNVTFNNAIKIILNQ